MIRLAGVQSYVELYESLLNVILLICASIWGDDSLTCKHMNMIYHIF